MGAIPRLHSPRLELPSCVACGRKTATPLCVDIGVVCNADCLYDIMPDHPMLNGYSPEHWEQREHMKEVEAKLQEAEDLARKYGFLS